MILSDNETCIDMINSKPIAKSIVQLIVDNKGEPITIGVHGDWGAGKSSVLEMIKDSLSSHKSIACIKFNGWKYQGFEDAKIALMESVVTTLIEERSLLTNAKDTVEKILKNINWLKVAKGVGSIAITAMTGMPPVTLITDAIDAIKKNIKDPEKVAGIIDSLGQFSKDSNLLAKDSTSIAFQEFQKLFDELMEKAEISKLVVLIDDLDRCLPNVAIETLEAVRLFMFSKSTAFIIAADESMIEYAVKKHFPDLPENEASKEFSRRYLEKLVQIPFKIPSLGELEAKTYIVLLLICSVHDEPSKEVDSLITIALDKIKKPWIGQGLTAEEIHSILGEKYDSVFERISIANQISRILSTGTAGNPRQIKRFINTLLLRQQIAYARGFGDEIKLPALAKLMLLERFFPALYTDIALHLLSDGTSSLITRLENKKETISDIPESESVGSPVGTDNKNAVVPEIDKQFKEWENNEALVEWGKIEPLIGQEDLRPYYFACKERKDLFLTQIMSEQIRELVQKLMGSRMSVASSTEALKALSNANAEMVFDIICSKIQENSNYSTVPSGIDGVKALVEHHSELQLKLIEFIKTFPVSDVGAWICTGWDKSITNSDCKQQLIGYIREIVQNGRDATVKRIAQAALK